MWEKLLSLGVLGAVVLIMYVDERYRIFEVSRLHAWSLFLAALYSPPPPYAFVFHFPG